MTQRTFGSALNDRSISHRIGERDAKLNQRRAYAREFDDQFSSSFKIRVAGRDERDEAFLAFSFERIEFFSDSTQKEFTTEDTECFSALSVILRVLCG